jgi:hypothetical protein
MALGDDTNKLQINDEIYKKKKKNLGDKVTVRLTERIPT